MPTCSNSESSGGRRVVVTGFGAVTPLGLNAADSWQNLLACKSGIVRVPDSLFKNDDITSKIAGIIPDSFKATDYLSSRVVNSSDRFMHLGLVAANEAIESSGWKPSSNREKERTAVIVGSGIGGVLSIEKYSIISDQQGARFVSPYFIPASLINLISGHIAIMHDYRGINFGLVSACSTGSHSIGEAMHMIRANRADVVICGGCEAALSRVGVAGFAAARALSTKYNDTPQIASRPWDKARDGFVIAEGAGVLVLEDEEHAIRRGARIYAIVAGYGASCDAFHITAPHAEGNGAFAAMRDALEDAHLNVRSVDYINAHGTSTPLGDMIEYRAVMRLLQSGTAESNAMNQITKKTEKSSVQDKNQAHIACNNKKSSNEEECLVNDSNNVACSNKTDAEISISANYGAPLLMSSTKSSIGHLLGAAGAVEAIFSILAINDGIAPATLNLDTPEDGICINLVPHQPVKKDIRVAMSNSFGFGGTNTSLVLTAH